MSIVLYDRSDLRKRLFPLVSTRPIGNLRIGILTIDLKWSKVFNTEVSFFTTDVLSNKYPLRVDPLESVLVINGGVCPDDGLVSAIQTLRNGELLMDNNGSWIVAKGIWREMESEIDLWRTWEQILYKGCYTRIRYPEDIFVNNVSQLQFDFKLLNADRISERPVNATVMGENPIFIEKGAKVAGAVLNANEGPIYIGENAHIEEGSFIRGNVCVGHNSRVKIGAKLYSNVSVGPHCVVGGELNNSVIWGDSNKGHDGYLGSAVIGQGCNIGGGSSNSNLQNNLKTVSLYDYKTAMYRDTGLLKCGLIMGDYSMCAINTSFTTGAVIGMGTQIAYSGFVPKWLPDFTWLTDNKKEKYNWDGFVEMLRRKAALKRESFSKLDEQLLQSVYQKFNDRL